MPIVPSQAGYPVNRRTNCPHIQDHVSPDWAKVTVDVSKPCTVCNDASENWRCLECQGVFCSSDLSTWCYACDDYVTDPLLKPIEAALHLSKFGTIPPDSGDIEIASEENSTAGGEGTSGSASKA